MGIRKIDALINQSVLESNDDADVPAALEHKTQDGSGDLLALPPSDFDEEDSK